MGMVAIRHHWSAAQVRELIARAPLHSPRYELIDGELVVTPSPGVPHQDAQGRLMALLVPYSLRNAFFKVWVSPADIELEEESITQPDIFVLPAEIKTDDSPVTWRDVDRLYLAIEILSPGSMRADRILKRNLYMRTSVAEYWIVDIDAQVIERWKPDVATPEIISETMRWLPAGASEPLEFNVREFFEKVRKDSGLPRII
jgi:Uma2 family endonuclease